MKVRSITFGVLFAVAMFAGSVSANVPLLTENAPGDGLHWNRKRIRIELSSSLLKSPTAIKPESDEIGAITRSFATWSDVTGIEFYFEWSDRQSVSAAGKTGDGVNLITIAPTSENLLAIGGDSGEVSARTRVFFGRRGEISEADVVLSPVQQFSTDGSFGTFDLQSTLTHEIGHMLGIDHSPVMAATMYQFQARNGTFNLPAVLGQTLSLDDVAAYRALYEPDAYATIVGRLLRYGGRPGSEIVVWAEEIGTGRVAAGRTTNGTGDFRLAGLEKGEYRLFFQSETTVGEDWVAGELGTLSVSVNRDYRFDRRLGRSFERPTADSIGFNGQFADLPILVNPDKSFAIFVTAARGNGGRTEMRGSSRFFVFGADQQNHDLGPDFAISSARVFVDEAAREGDYTVSVANASGNQRFFIGALSIDRYSNPWSLYDLK